MMRVIFSQEKKNTDQITITQGTLLQIGLKLEDHRKQNDVEILKRSFPRRKENETSISLFQIDRQSA